MSQHLVDQVEVTRARISDKLILRHLTQLYNYDFTEFDGSDVDEHGLYRDDYLDHYWTDKTRHPYLVRVAGKVAGFAFVKLNKSDDGSPYTGMAEFFILKKYRGQGIGQAVAFHLFDAYPGKWEVGEIPTNLPAQAFWRKIIGRYTGGQFEEVTIEGKEVYQAFRSRSAVSSPGEG